MKKSFHSGEEVGLGVFKNSATISGIVRLLKGVWGLTPFEELCSRVESPLESFLNRRQRRSFSMGVRPYLQ